MGQQGNQRGLPKGAGKGPAAPALTPPRNDQGSTPSIGTSSTDRPNAYPRSPAGPPGRKK